MAVEKDFELLDDYLSNRLRGQDKTVFEQKLKGDLELKAEHQFQQKLVEGIRNARVSELKSMLNNTAVPTVGGDTALFTKVAIGVVILGFIGAGSYIYLNQNEPTLPVIEKTTQTQTTEKAAPTQKETITEENTPAKEEKVTATETRHEKRAHTKEEKEELQRMFSLPRKKKR